MTPGPEKIVHEWRVEATAVWPPDNAGMPYGFTWDSQRHADPETSARAFMDSHAFRRDCKDIILKHRIVTFSRWEVM